MPSLSNRVRDLRESAIRKLDLDVAAQHDVVFHRLNIGQPDVPTPQSMLDAIRAFQPRVLAYGPASGTPSCRAAAAAYHARWSPGLHARHVAVTVGGSEALVFAMMATCDPGDEILVPEPFYTNYNGFALLAGASVVPVPAHLDHGFALPSDAVLDTLCTPRTRAVLFSNPGNPTGAVYSRSELERLVAWAQRHDLFVIADEVYRRIWFDEPPASALELEHAHDAVICVDSLSKTYSACGSRLGFLISRNAELMERVERLGQSRLGPQPLAQAVAEAALALPDSHYEQVRLTYKRRMDTLLRALEPIPGVRIPRPRGAFYAMVGLPIDDSEAFARFLVTEFRMDGESVVVAPGSGFYADPSRGRDEIRLAAVLDEVRIRRAANILAAAIRAFAG